MGTDLQFDYYYGSESEQFSFYRVPKLLIKDSRFRGISSDAKLLYGLMLERMSLSIKNGWLDDKNRAYIIYTIDSVMEDLCCGKEKAVKILSELDNKKGIGLIERVRRGLGKPDLIYVKNFVIKETKPEPTKKDEPSNSNNDETKGKTEEKPSENPANTQKSENPTSRGSMVDFAEVGESNFKESEKPTSEVGKADSSYSNSSYPNTDTYTNPSIYQSSVYSVDGIDKMDNNACIALIKKHLRYDSLLAKDEYAYRDILRDSFQLICDVICMPCDSMTIGGVSYPHERIRDRFLELDWRHIEYVGESLKNTATEIRNIRAYLLAALYNAPSSINTYRHLYGYGGK